MKRGAGSGKRGAGSGEREAGREKETILSLFLISGYRRIS